MKKLNNKGFAITTVVYGLSIMGILLVAILMATMSTNRSNTSQLAKAIEEDLNRFSKTETSFEALTSGDYPTAQAYTVPEGQSGWYRIELWGTQGGGNGGNGAYTSGVIKLEEGQTLYFYVGKHQTTSGSGRSTDVRIDSGAYNDINSYETRIMVAAGGGSTTTASGGTLYGYNATMYSTGGALNNSYELTNSNGRNGSLLGYPSGYTTSSVTQVPSGNIASPVGQNGGGDGYFASTDSNIGGTSFISGYGGCYALSKSGNSYALGSSPSFKYYPREYNEASDTYVLSGAAQEFYFNDGFMIPGANKGDGHARIERVVELTDTITELPRKNKNMEKIKQIRDCNDSGLATNLVATNNGELVTGFSSSTSGNCVTWTRSMPIKIDEIAIWHNTTIGSNLENNEISVCIANNCSVEANWRILKAKSSRTTLSETETVTGTRISAYQYDATGPMPTGTYYIMPVLSENKVVTAQESALTDNDPIKIEYLNGEKRQRWSVELITDTSISPSYNPTNSETYEYKILELARYKALNIQGDENMAGNKTVANTTFNNSARNAPQIWKINSMGNRTYSIESSAVRFESTTPSGALIPIPYPTNNWDASQRDTLLIGKAKMSGSVEMLDTERFKFISLDY